MQSARISLNPTHRPFNMCSLFRHKKIFFLYSMLVQGLHTKNCENTNEPIKFFAPKTEIQYIIFPCLYIFNYIFLAAIFCIKKTIFNQKQIQLKRTFLQ